MEAGSGDPGRAQPSPPDTDRAQPSEPTASVAELDRYRAAIVALCAELADLAAGTNQVEQLESRLRVELKQPDVALVLDTALGGVDGVIASLRDEIARFRPDSPSSAPDIWAVMRIFLLSQIDSYWWRTVEPFHVADLHGTNNLVDLRRRGAHGELAFRFKLQPKGLPGRVRNGVVHRFLPRYEPRTAGVSHAMAAPELVTLLNRVARDFAHASPAGTPPLWVTSLLRTVEHQHHLRGLGYSAFFPSAHCVGYAADLEFRWYEQFGATDALAAILLDSQARGLINVVDEGQIWHVCLSPQAAADLRAR